MTCDYSPVMSYHIKKLLRISSQSVVCAHFLFLQNVRALDVCPLFGILGSMWKLFVAETFNLRMTLESKRCKMSTKYYLFSSSTGGDGLLRNSRSYQNWEIAKWRNWLIMLIFFLICYWHFVNSLNSWIIGKQFLDAGVIHTGHSFILSYFCHIELSTSH